LELIKNTAALAAVDFLFAVADSQWI